MLSQKASWEVAWIQTATDCIVSVFWNSWLLDVISIELILSVEDSRRLPQHVSSFISTRSLGIHSVHLTIVSHQRGCGVMICMYSREALKLGVTNILSLDLMKPLEHEVGSLGACSWVCSFAWAMLADLVSNNYDIFILSHKSNIISMFLRFSLLQKNVKIISLESKPVSSEK